MAPESPAKHISEVMQMANLIAKEDKPEQLLSSLECNNNSSSRSWTSEEQRQLENGLRLYPSSDSERWNKIAVLIPNKTNHECQARYRLIVQRIKQKKGTSKLK